MIYVYYRDPDPNRPDESAREYMEIEARMADAPPARYVDEDGVEWWRDWSGVQLAAPEDWDGATSHAGDAIPTSRSVPASRAPFTYDTLHGQTIRKHRDGSRSTADGRRRIVATREDARVVEATTGMKRMHDADD